MGYRSDVAYLIAGETTDIQTFLITIRLTRPDLAGALREITVGMLADSTENSYIGFLTESVKWYSDYTDVKWHEALWELAEETELFDGRFCRIGEDSDDIEIKQFGDGHLDLYDYVDTARPILEIGFGTGPEDDVRAKWKEDPTWRSMPLPLPAPAKPDKPSKSKKLKKPKRARPNLRSTSSTIMPRKWRATGGASSAATTTGGTIPTTTR